MNFYDTSALLDLGAAAFEPAALPFLIADMTLHELEEIKTSGKKTEEIRYKARTVTRLLAEHRDDGSYTVVAVPMTSLFYILDGKPISDNNDATIMATARWWLDQQKQNLDDLPTVLDEASSNQAAYISSLIDSFKFVTSDLSCANIASGILQLPVEFTFPNATTTKNDYTGWTEVALADGGEEAMAMAYSKDAEQRNLFDTPTNGYILIPNADADGNTAAIRWDGVRWNPLRYKNLNTAYSGKIKPLNDQQRLAFDLLQNDDITIKLLLGVYGSGKDFLMVNHAIDLIEKGKYDRIVWVRNTVEVKNSRSIGFLPGTANEKLMPYAGPLSDTLGGDVALERAIIDGWVKLEHLGPIRGRSYKRSIIYCSEAENLTKEHVQLLIGRVGGDSALWLNGDLRQIDDVVFESNNGLRKAIECLTGQQRFGVVYMPISERSETAKLADLLD